MNSRAKVMQKSGWTRTTSSADCRIGPELSKEDVSDPFFMTGAAIENCFILNEIRVAKNYNVYYGTSVEWSLIRGS